MIISISVCVYDLVGKGKLYTFRPILPNVLAQWTYIEAESGREIVGKRLTVKSFYIFKFISACVLIYLQIECDFSYMYTYVRMCDPNVWCCKMIEKRAYKHTHTLHIGSDRIGLWAGRQFCCQLVNSQTIYISHHAIRANLFECMHGCVCVRRSVILSIYIYLCYYYLV